MVPIYSVRTTYTKPQPPEFPFGPRRRTRTRYFYTANGVQNHILKAIDEQHVREIRASRRSLYFEQFTRFLIIDFDLHEPSGTIYPYFFVSWLDTKAFFGSDRITAHLKAKFPTGGEVSCG